MKRLILFLVVTLFFLGCNYKNSGDKLATDFLNRLDKKDFFNVLNEFKLQKEKMNKKNQLYVGAYLDYTFRKYQESNEKIIELINKHKNELCDSIIYELLAIKTENYYHLFEYKLAAETQKVLLTEFTHLMDSTVISSRGNRQNEYETLAMIPKQKLIKKKDSRIKYKRDVINLVNIGVHFMTKKSDSVLDFVFDTGADVNVIQESVAEDLGLETLEGSIEILGATGYTMNARFAFADSISMGEMVFYNVIFTVLPDEFLNVVPDLNYSIKGIIGTPVISMMEEVRFNKDEIIIPKIPIKYTYQNFALDYRSPIVLCMIDGDSLRFLFDTGARKTHLYKLYFDNYKSDITSKYQIEELTVLGAGETRKVQGYIIDIVPLKIGGALCVLDSIQVHPELVSPGESDLHGGIGQDFISNFKEMIISYKYSSILFN